MVLNTKKSQVSKTIDAMSSFFQDFQRPPWCRVSLCLPMTLSRIISSRSMERRLKYRDGSNNNNKCMLYSSTTERRMDDQPSRCFTRSSSSKCRHRRRRSTKRSISLLETTLYYYYSGITAVVIIYATTNTLFVEVDAASSPNDNNYFTKAPPFHHPGHDHDDPTNFVSSSSTDLSAYPNNYYPTGPFYQDRLSVTPPLRRSSNSQILSNQPQQPRGGRRRPPRRGKDRGRRGKFAIDIQGNRQHPLSRVQRLVTRDHDTTTTTTTTTATSKRREQNNNNIRTTTTNDDDGDDKSDHHQPPQNTSPHLVQTELSLSLTPMALVRLARLGWEVAASLSVASLGTLRLLAPMIVARRAINSTGDLVMDYATGRYIRKTYTRMEQLYLNYYEMPAAFRSFCRVNSQLGILLVLSKIMSWLVGIDHAPCKVISSSSSALPSVANWCGLLWIGAVIGTGHAFSTAVAVWGGPLRVQVAAEHLHTGRVRAFTKPWHIFQWLENPEGWINMMAASPQQYPNNMNNRNKLRRAAAAGAALPYHNNGNNVRRPQQFDPNPILFPATWVPLRLYLLAAGGLIISNCPGTWKSHKNPITTIMKQFLVHVTLSDEWYRVFFGEKRVGLGCFVAFSYFISTTSLVITALNINGISALMLLPTLIAVIISGYMNLIIFWNRLEDHHRKYAIDAFNERKDAALKALNL